jgi:hypothetical protein
LDGGVNTIPGCSLVSCTLRGRFLPPSSRSARATLGSQKELHQIEQPVTVRKEVRTDVKQIALYSAARVGKLTCDVETAYMTISQNGHANDTIVTIVVEHPCLGPVGPRLSVPNLTAI